MPTLEITTLVGCPLACTFCPQDKLVANYPGDAVRALSLNAFKTILAKVPKHVRIDFSGMSEPWANRFATAMLACALEDGRNVAVYTTLQGMRDADLVASLLTEYAGQVEAVVVHLPDGRGNMRGFKQTGVYDKALSAFRELEGVLGERLQFMTMDEDNASPVGSVTMPWSALGRAGNLDRSGVSGQAIESDPHHSTPLTCSYTPFYDQNVLLPNGDVVLCCMDYSSQHKLGNLLTDDYYDLFSSEAFSQLVASNMQYADKGSICRKCSRARTHDLGETKHFWSWSC